MISDADRRAAADALATAERERAPIAPLTERWPDLDVVDAYEIQLRNIANRVAAGRIVRGQKVGLSSRAMQEMMGVNEPDYGHLLDDMFAFEQGEVATNTMCSPRVEVEVAFVLGERLTGPACNVADVLRATEYLLPAIEIIDSRIRDWKITLPDTIADNASSALVVAGATPRRVDALDLRTTGALLSLNGRIVETGATGAVLGNPAIAVAWLANKLHSFGIALEVGHVVLPGSCTRAVPVAPGDSVLATFDGLGSVSVNFV